VRIYAFGEGHIHFEHAYNNARIDYVDFCTCSFVLFTCVHIYMHTLPYKMLSILHVGRTVDPYVANGLFSFVNNRDIFYDLHSD
jgi:hypothetical protein